MKNIQKENFDNLCRFCLKDNILLKSIFNNNDLIKECKSSETLLTKYNKNNDYKFELGGSTIEMIELCTGLMIKSNDKLPKCLCINCLKQLTITNRFRKRCHTSTQLLLKILDEHNKSTIIENDIIKYNDCASNDVESIINYNSEKEDQMRTILSNEQFNEIDENSTTPISNKILQKQSELTEINKQKKRLLVKKIKPIKTNSKDIELTIKKRRRQKPIQCEICGAMRTDLRRHLLIHFGEKKFECDYCNKKFVARDDLKKHIYAHIDLRRYKCEFCPKTFRTGTHRKRHLYTHTGERNYMCDLCDRSFASSGSRDLHRLAHTQDRRFSCQYCSKTFLSSGGLRCHIGIHTGERLFPCGLCSLTFKNTSSAAVHRRNIHIKGQFYHCDNCGMETKDLRWFKKHLREQHGNENVS